jgi:hypothetical protein
MRNAAVQNRFELFEGQQKFTSHFYYLLSKKLSSFSEISHSIKAFQLIHLNGKAVGLRECEELDINLFDEHGNWNNNTVSIDENKAPLFDDLWERVDDILYPNILEQTVSLSDKEQIILCALVYEIQTDLINTYLFNNKIDTEAALVIRQKIFKAAHDAVATTLPSLKMLLKWAQSQEDQKNHDDCKCVIC